VIEIVTVAGLATIQDRGRVGHMHEGVPPGGALVPELLARANSAARNAHGEAAIELVGRITFSARRPVVIATDAGEQRELAADETCTIAAEGARVRYIALRGGIDVPSVLGGRGTLVVAALGGHEGRPLRRGDSLFVGSAPMCDACDDEGRLPPPVDLEGPIFIVPGPDRERFEALAVDALLSSTFAIDPRSDRVGIRLTGSVQVRPRPDASVSAPMVRGAIQVPPSGELIVLGPDHPTTGGYPVIATVVRRCLGSLAARPLRSAVRFAA
jgi:5-oxoprolinase (ATP-hydrolysing) subunit C